MFSSSKNLQLSKSREIMSQIERQSNPSLAHLNERTPSVQFMLAPGKRESPLKTEPNFMFSI
jgi:hypothetical protein